jgi:hypothetical protein
MTLMYRTLQVTPSDEGVLGLVIDAPPMNPIGPELAHDLVMLIGALESGQETRGMVLESADPDYLIPHVDLTKVDQYTAEAAKAGGPDDASLGMLWHKLSQLPVVTMRRSAAGPAERAANWPWRATCGTPRGRTPSWDRSRSAPPDPGRGRRAAPGPAAGPGPGHGGDPRRGRLRRRSSRTVRLDQPSPARRRPGRVRGPARAAHRVVPRHAVRTVKQVLNELTLPRGSTSWSPRTRPKLARPPCSRRACKPAARSNSTSATASEPFNRETDLIGGVDQPAELMPSERGLRSAPFRISASRPDDWSGADGDVQP